MSVAPPPGLLDAIAGVPLSPAVLSAWNSAASQAYSDPARMHHAGRKSGLLLESARTSIAHSLGVSPQNVFFAASAPDAIRAAIVGIYRVRSAISHQVLVGAVESMAVMGSTQSLPEVEIVTIDCNEWGAISIDSLLNSLEQAPPNGPALVCLQVANAEVGTRQPFGQALAACRERGVPVIADSTAVITRDQLPADFDVLIAPARDWGGPPGVAILITAPHLRWRPEEAPDRGWIGGFPDIPAAAAAAVALEESIDWSSSANQARHQIGQVRTALEASGLTCAGDENNRLPHILTFTITGAAAGALVTELDKRGISVAAGSACTADTRMPSHVLEAMGLPNDASIRISLPRNCSQETIDTFLRELPLALEHVRNN